MDLPQRAIDLYQDAEPVLRNAQSIRQLAMLYNNMGIEFRKLNEWCRAKNAYIASIEWWRVLNNPIALANVQDGLGLTLQAMNRSCEAQHVLKDALCQLSAHKSHPAYQALFDEINGHLNQVNTEIES